MADEPKTYTAGTLPPTTTTSEPILKPCRKCGESYAEADIVGFTVHQQGHCLIAQRDALRLRLADEVTAHARTCVMLHAAQAEADNNLAAYNAQSLAHAEEKDRRLALETALREVQRESIVTQSWEKLAPKIRAIVDAALGSRE